MNTYQIAVEKYSNRIRRTNVSKIKSFRLYTNVPSILEIESILVKDFYKNLC